MTIIMVFKMYSKMKRFARGASTFLVLKIGIWCSLIGQRPGHAPAKASSVRHIPELAAPAREEASERDTNRHNAGGSAA